MKFDWYGATVQRGRMDVQEALKAQKGGSFLAAKALHSYEFAERHDPTRALLMWGGHNPGVYVQGTGQDAPAVADFLRATYPDAHRVSRLDVALDYDEPGAFQRIAGLVLPIVREAGMKPRFLGDPEADPDPESGRNGWTWYFGGATSDVQARLYEKGLKERAGGALDASPHWVRFEVQARPRKARKALCASLRPAQVWGLARWSQAAYAEVARELVPFVPDPSLRRSSHETALDHVCKQYGATLSYFRDELGEAGLAEEIARRLDARAEAKRERRREQWQRRVA